jgi:hypothetical protein
VEHINKIVTDIQNIYTYYEFSNYNTWEDYDDLLMILTAYIKCTVLEKLDGIYSRHCVLEKGAFPFKLLFHEDFGNCLCNQNKKDDEYYNHLECIAEEVISKLRLSAVDSNG